jgi:hypothetical protein
LTSLNKATLWTAILHGLILIPWGHGAAPLILFEAVCIPDFVSNGLSLSGSEGDYEKAVNISILLSLFGHVLLVAGLLFKSGIRKLRLIVVGLALFVASNLNLLFHSFDFWGYMFVFSVPFWAAAVWLATACVRNWKACRYIA